MEKVKVEVRAAEGGEDSKLLVKEMVQIYKKAIVKRGFTLESEY